MVKCPECKSSNVAKILWGLPANFDELKPDLDAGKIVLGGCIVSGCDPTHSCNKCGHSWRKSRSGKGCPSD